MKVSDLLRRSYDALSHSVHFPQLVRALLINTVLVSELQMAPLEHA